MHSLHRRRKISIIDNVIAGLFVALFITLLNILDSYLPKDLLSQNLINLINGIVVIAFLYLVLHVSHRI